MTVSVLVIMTHVHATIILNPASVISLAITSLSLQQLVQYMNVCFIMTHTSALVLSTTCTATQVYIISITVETIITVSMMTVTALVMGTPVHATVIHHPPASVQTLAITSLSLQQLVQSMTVGFITTHTSALVLSTACTATQKCIISTTGDIETKTNMNMNAGVITVTALVIRIPVHATVAHYPPASVRLTAIALLSLQQLVQSQTLTVCFIIK